MSKDYSTHPVRSCIWDFKIGDDDEGLCSSTVAVGYDILHNIELGVWCYIVERTDDYLISVYGSCQGQQTVTEMNRWAGTTSG